MKASISLEGATALVTGAGSGIGRATSLALARRGSTVLAVDIDEAAAKATAAACAELGKVAQACTSATSPDRAVVEALATQVERDHGALDVLVNNAGVGMSARFADMSLDDWEWIRSINLDGVVYAGATPSAGRCSPAAAATS